jgi:glycosyltransferase involved in cell wall biosynthesis
MRVAIVHEWLTVYAGSEKVLARMLDVFPEADLFAVVDFLPQDQRPLLGGKRAETTFIQRLPRARTRYRSYLPLMPFAVEQLDLAGYDLVISNNHAVAKGVRTAPDQLHVCLCHSPMRYAWDLQEQYLRAAGLGRGVRGALTRAILHRLRTWDRATAAGVDRFIAISDFIAGRIAKAYRREATVLRSPIDAAAFPLQTDKGDAYLAASRMVPYKRMDLIVEAFRQMPDRRLTVVGDGPQEKRIRRAAAGAENIEFLGRVTDRELADRMGAAKAFVFAALEDLGLMPIEAMACGTPVIALARGGTAETVKDGETGVLFGRQSVESIRTAVERFEQIDGWDAAAIRVRAETFDQSHWRQRFSEIIQQAWDEFPHKRPATR